MTAANAELILIPVFHFDGCKAEIHEILPFCIAEMLGVGGMA
jgi:hypothetical protein